MEAKAADRSHQDICHFMATASLISDKASSPVGTERGEDGREKKERGAGKCLGAAAIKVMWCSLFYFSKRTCPKYSQWRGLVSHIRHWIQGFAVISGPQNWSCIGECLQNAGCLHRQWVCAYACGSFHFGREWRPAEIIKA